jgi:DNA-binding MarR family transcriptional regulator
MAAYRVKESLGFLVNWAGRSLSTRLSRNFTEAGYDVTPEQWGLLGFLWERDGQTQRELCQATGKDKGTITRLVHGMEKRDLVVRVPDKRDLRNKLIYLTHRGQELREVLVPPAEHCLELAQAGVSPQDLAACKKVLRRVIENLGTID